MYFRCRIHGCTVLQLNGQDQEIHEASDWHCPDCGFSDMSELTNENIHQLCKDCEAFRETGKRVFGSRGVAK